MSALQSVLGKVLGRSPTNETDLRSLAAAVWHQTGFICIRASWIKSPIDQEYVTQLATKVHGKRRVGAK